MLVFGAPARPRVLIDRELGVREVWYWREASSAPAHRERESRTLPASTSRCARPPRHARRRARSARRIRLRAHRSSRKLRETRSRSISHRRATANDSRTSWNAATESIALRSEPRRRAPCSKSRWPAARCISGRKAIWVSESVIAIDASLGGLLTAVELPALRRARGLREPLISGSRNAFVSGVEFLRQPPGRNVRYRVLRVRYHPFRVSW